MYLTVPKDPDLLVRKGPLHAIRVISKAIIIIIIIINLFFFFSFSSIRAVDVELCGLTATSCAKML